MAQYTLGDCYRNGRGVENSNSIAVYWYEKLVGQPEGFVPPAVIAEAITKLNRTYFDLGAVHFRGQGVEQSYSKAIEWWGKAAEREHAKAQCNLGIMYSSGAHVEQSYEKALKWYEKAAKQGDAAAQCGLGIMYEYGQGVEKCDSLALQWYEMAAIQGEEQAKERRTKVLQRQRNQSL